jgi:K+-transporting ATPase KdpF subunit
MAHPEYLIVGIIAALVGIYLLAALLWPERF